ncbi:MAG: hypothetical protein H0T46_27955 [Deltaproteobacteria bacterium]|nr:hypothetical protein [Deltaproteobacteria bacterium]
MKRAALALVCLLATRAEAEPQLQLDLGVGLIGLGVELPICDCFSVQVEATGLSTFYLPLIGGGITTYAFGGGTRATWFPGRDPAGLYVAAAMRVERAAGDTSLGERATGLLLAPALTVGQGFRPTKKVDVRFGFGAQWIHYNLKTPSGRLKADVPFLMVELVLGYRL